MGILHFRPWSCRYLYIIIFETFFSANFFSGKLGLLEPSKIILLYYIAAFAVL